MITKKVDIVIFSFDRPLQLFALIESIQNNVSGINEIHVIYRSSSDKYRQEYNNVFKTFPIIIHHIQGPNQLFDFKRLLLKVIFESISHYVVFAVDDNIVKEGINLIECTYYMEKYNAYGFFLRLGTHLTFNYPNNCNQPLPPLAQVEPCLYQWRFGEALYDWGYPHTVDMTIYRKKDIYPIFQILDYDNPNYLEGNWNLLAYTATNKTGLCFERSKIVNLPLNRVQQTFTNRSMNEYSTADLLDIFKRGKKMDIGPLQGFINKSAHMEWNPTFIDR